MDKYQLSDRDICTQFITPAIQQAGWQQHQFREEIGLTDGRVMVHCKLAARIRNAEAKGGPKRADSVFYARPNVPIAIVEAKQARFSVGPGMQQALTYAEMRDAPFALSSNGDGFLIHDRTAEVAEVSGQIIPFEAKYRAQHIGLRYLKGLLELCQKKSIDRGYVVTKALDDFEVIPGLPDTNTWILRIPAPLLCYWMGETELVQRANKL